MMNAPSIYVHAAQLRMYSRYTVQRCASATKALRQEADKVVLLRTATRQILEETARLNEMLRLREHRIYRQFTFFGQLVDGTGPHQVQPAIANMSGIGYAALNDQCGTRRSHSG